MIAYYNGAPEGTRDTIVYVEKKGVEVITNNPDYKPKERNNRYKDGELKLKLAAAEEIKKQLAV